MAALLPVGMPLAQALNAASGVTTGEVRAALVEVRGRVERGETLSSALAQYPQLFSPLYVGLVRAGESAAAIWTARSRGSPISSSATSSCAAKSCRRRSIRCCSRRPGPSP